VLWAHLCGLREEISGSPPISCANRCFCANPELIEAGLGIGWIATVLDSLGDWWLQVLKGIE
jgi:hypothetical protein